MGVRGQLRAFRVGLDLASIYAEQGQAELVCQGFARCGGSFMARVGTRRAVHTLVAYPH